MANEIRLRNVPDSLMKTLKDVERAKNFKTSTETIEWLLETHPKQIAIIKELRENNEALIKQLEKLPVLENQMINLTTSLLSDLNSHTKFVSKELEAFKEAKKKRIEAGKKSGTKTKTGSRRS